MVCCNEGTSLRVLAGSLQGKRIYIDVWHKLECLIKTDFYVQVCGIARNIVSEFGKSSSHFDIN